MDTEAIQTARDSLTRCKRDPGFLKRFYELFIEESPEIQEKFANTDLERQRKVLSDSLFLMLTASGTKMGFAHRELEKLAKRHSRAQLDVKPEWYDLWLDCLLKSVAEFDPEYSEELDTAWRESLRDGIELLKLGY